MSVGLRASYIVLARCGAFWYALRIVTDGAEDGTIATLTMIVQAVFRVIALHGIMYHCSGLFWGCRV